ncbi:putative transmembrane protein [Senna tora]|uniref:Putative transmembrane protein n=1 Tax=Senna tora TaxID=362788 RepID=A0A834TIJ9_9FABA|nr:putative transmembrane protein [Senna tora]
MLPSDRFQVGNVSKKPSILISRVLHTPKTQRYASFVKFGEIDLHQMDQTISRDKDFEFDLESGGNTSEEDVFRDLDSSERESISSFSLAWNRLLNLDGSKQHETGVETCSSSSKSGDVVDDNVKLLVDTYLEDVQKQLSPVKSNNAKGKKKKTNSKPSKPPRPPKGPSLDAADQKLVKEISELALRKRERIKKIKAVRKMKARKASSSYTGFSALVITIFFLTVIILQGIKSGSSAVVGLMASPEPAVASDEGLISVHFPKSFSNEGDAPGSQYSTVNSFSMNLSSNSSRIDDTDTMKTVCLST